MKQNLIIILVSAVTALVVGLGVAYFGPQVPGAILGGNGLTRYPQSGLYARSFSTSATTTSAAAQGSLTISGVSTLTGALNTAGAVNASGTVTVQTTSTFRGGINFNASTTGLILRSTNDGACVVLQYTGTTGVIATTSITCP